MTMDCNRDEALRAKEIAEKKLAVHDYASALKFAHKAQQLFPGLENLSQMLAVIDVHVAAQVKLIGTEVDWYRILQVDATADEMLIKKQYKKLALLLHPDKNKFVGAEAAFKLIGEASQILSDKTKRVLHDMKRGGSFPGSQNFSVSQYDQNVQTSHSNGQYHGMKSQPINNANGQYPRMPPQAPSQTSTFWTACPSCQMRFQYLRTYENQNLLCPQCRLPFVAKDISSMQGSAAYGWSPHYGSQQQQDFSRSFSKTFGTGFSSLNGFASGVKVDSFQSNTAYGGGLAATVPPAGTKTTEEYAQHMNDKVRREKDKAEAEREQRRKKKEEERKEKEIERELKRIEREQLRKAKNEERTREAMDRLMSKKKEQAEKAAVKDKKRRLKRHRSEGGSEDEEEQDETLEDMLSDDQDMTQGDNSEGYVRRSFRARRNVTYKVESDDEDLEDFPASKKARGIADGEELDDVAGSGGGASATGVKSTGVASQSQTQSEAQNDVTKKLADFAKNAIREKLNLRGVKSGVTLDSNVQETKNMDVGKEENPHMTPGNKKEEREEKPRGLMAGVAERASSEGKGLSKGGFEGKKSVAEDSAELPISPEEPEPESYSVPDADFHNFDKDREEKDIKAGQIWALYDDQDGMPRYYIRVKAVKFHSRFKVTINWLEPDQIQPLESEFTWGCGDFRPAKSQVMDSVNAFSHIVKWERGPNGSTRVCPTKGDIWGLYRDWEPGQRTMKVADTPFKYNMVEVVTEYNDQTGVVVKHLVKVQGFKTLFQQSEEPTLQIPSTELQRFSHQVPAFKLTGDEVQGVPQGCWELDPASVPWDLIFPGRV